MKKITLIILIIIIGKTTSFSQKYQPFDSTTVWVANQVYKICTNCYLGRDIKYFIKGYEINNGRLWNKVYCNDVTYFAFCMTCTWTPLPTNTNKLIGYYSNDTVNKVVFYYQFTPLPPNYNPTSFDSLYYFKNKMIGDSLLLRSSPNYKFKINNIDSFMFSGKYHKRYQTNCIPTTNPINSSTISFIEGIGSSLGPFEPMLHPGGEEYSYLNCFSSPSQTVTVTNYTVLSSGSCANLTLDINEIESSQSIIYPNPNNGSFKLKISNDIDQIILFNSLGQKVYEQKLNRGTNEVSTDKLSSGLYHYVLFQNKQRTSSGKLTVE